MLEGESFRKWHEPRTKIFIHSLSLCDCQAQFQAATFIVGCNRSPFVHCEVQKHLGDHDAVKQDVEHESDEDWAITGLNRVSRIT